MPSSGFQTCARSEEHTSELQSHSHLVCRLLLTRKKVEWSSDVCSAGKSTCLDYTHTHISDPRFLHLDSLTLLFILDLYSISLSHSTHYFPISSSLPLPRSLAVPTSHVC